VNWRDICQLLLFLATTWEEFCLFSALYAKMVHWMISKYWAPFVAVLGFALMDFQLIGRHPIVWTMPVVLFALVIYQIVSCIWPRSAGSLFFLFILPKFLGWQMWTTVLSYWLRWGLAKFCIAQVSWNCDAPDVFLPNSYDYNHDIQVC
jgi:hypothetical protein